MSENFPTDSTQPHAVHPLEGGTRICGGTVPPTLAQFLPAMGDDIEKVRVDIFRVGTEPHQPTNPSQLLAQEIIPYGTEYSGFSADVAARFIGEALRINKISQPPLDVVLGVLPRATTETVIPDPALLGEVPTGIKENADDSRIRQITELHKGRHLQLESDTI